MDKIHLSSFYECDNIDLACELYYVCELGKYLKYKFDKVLSLSNIKFDKILTQSNIWFYFCMALQEEWIVDITVPDYWLLDLDSLTPKEWKDKTLVLKNVMYTTETVQIDYEDLRKRKDSYEYDLRVPQLCQIAFKEIKGAWYCFDMTSNVDNLTIVNNMSINGVLPQYSWLSLVAYGAVRRCIDILNNAITPFRLAIIFTDTSIINERALSYILLLADKGKCFNREWFAYMFSEKVSLEQQRHIGYVAWYVEGEEKGLLSKKEWYNSVSKQQRLKELGISKGSVVFLFERPNLQRYNYIKTISDCKIVIVEDINRKYCLFRW